MNFELTEDRRMLSDTLNRYLVERYPLGERNRLAYEAPFHDPARWGEMAELRIAGALVPEKAGGLGGSGFDIAVVFEALGQSLCPEPFLGALLASRLLLAAGADQGALIEGSRRYALGLSEIDAPYDLASIETTAHADAELFRLAGRKCAVYGGQDADTFLLVARLDRKPAVFEADAADLHVVGYGMIDGGGAADVLLDNSPARLLMADAEAAIASAVRAGQLALCAEAVGAMDAALALLLDYLKTRKQFGVTIGSFQALQHRCADLLTEIEQARSITIAAAAALDEPDGQLKAAMAKSLIGRVARQVAEETVQMHGGIAMTWEYAASHYAKRLIMLDHALGDTDHCLEQVMRSYAA